MEITENALSGKKSIALSKTQPMASTGYDYFALFLSLWFISGGSVDSWAHRHVARLETFFTPWHAVLYSSLLALLCFYGGTMIFYRSKGYAWSQAAPQGYVLSCLGVGIFFVSGVCDFIWHSLFGIEQNFETQLSPTHLFLAFGGAFIITGPLRSAWLRFRGRKPYGWKKLLPMVICAAGLLVHLGGLSQFAHPFVDTYAAKNQAILGSIDVVQHLGVTGMIFQALLLMGILLIVVRRWQLPFGALTLIFTIDACAISFLNDHLFLVPGGLATGLFADLLVLWLKPSIKEPWTVRIFAFIVPVVWYIFYYASLTVVVGVVWSIHLWLGSAVIAGMACVLLSYVHIQPMQFTEVVDKEGGTIR
ncbi:MAG TPA: hypothetical protein VKR06_01010 [Ktedonosporobacter sp.]|nr:hypothetical protein [Ktedonosporobacter sp.]